MKYNFLNQAIPQEKRKELNEKILYLINNNLCEKYNITKEIIYNSYTGEGGLHELNFKNFNSFYDYTKAKQEIENGQFFTGHQESKFLIDCLGIKENETVLDLTCGKGDLFNFLPNENNIYGNELDINAYNVCRYLYSNANITHGDMRDYKPSMLFDVIIGNPPFNLLMTYNKEKMLSQMVYIQKCTEILKTGGILALIVPKSFLNDEFSNKSDIEYMNENYSFIGQVLLNKNAFSHVGVDNFQTKIILFHKKSVYIPCKTFNNSFIDGNSNYIYDNCIKPIRAIKEQYSANIKLENFKNFDSNKDKNFNDTVTKILFDIKRSKHVKHKYNECFNYYQQYYNQVKPESMKYEEWESIRITKKEVIDMLKNTLSSQHKKKSTYKNNMGKVLRRKEKEYINQSQKFDNMKIDKNIENWLSDSVLFNYIEGVETKLNDKQKYDLNKILQKKYALLQWDMGSGKSYTSLHYGKYRLEKNNCKNIFVVAPAIAIKNTYVDMLENFNLPFRIINTKDDINKINRGEFLLFTFNMVIKTERWIKKFLKQQGKNFALILDESDSICNIDSKRCKSVLSCFRSSIKYKLLLSGTSVRNSINEIYTQLELLYNNSYNMVCENELIYVEDKEQKNIKEVYNEDVNKPYHAYKKGYKLFTESHIPKKQSVFGVAKYEQNVYNKDNLKKIIEKTIITRTLKDITGKELYNINQVTCDFTNAEKKLYNKILKQFHEMSQEYHIKTGNAKKDSMFRILAILNTLLKSCSTSHTFKEYEGVEISTKVKTVIDMLKNFENEKVAIGCTRIKTVETYRKEIKKAFPDRKIFVITGQNTTLKQRKNLVEEMKKYKNCIVISSQMALSCSMNIGFINKVIIPEMQWNDGSTGQYRARFSRLNSEEKTEIYNVFYKNSIEVNLLKLNLAKEKLCMLMKNEDVANEELQEKYGVDPAMLIGLMVKEKDIDGTININWGEQEII